MLSLRSLFVSFTAAVACVTSVVAAPSTSFSSNSLTLVPRGAIFDPRCDCYLSPLPVVIDDCTSKITPLVAKLKSLDASESTSGNIKPIVDEIKGVLTEGVTHLTLLAKGNAQVDLILSNGNGTLSVSDCATLLAGLVNLILVSLSVVLKRVSSSDSKEIILIFEDLCVSLADLLNLSVSLVVTEGGLLAAVVPLIKDSLGVIVTLGITSYYSFLNLDLLSLGVDIGMGVGATNGSTSLVAIVRTALNAIQPLIDQLKTLQPSDCNAYKIGPIVGEIRAILLVAVSQLSVLVGQNTPSEVLFLLDGKVLSLNDCADIIGDLVNIVSDGICETIKIVSFSEAKAVIALFMDIGLAMGQLLKLSIAINGDLLPLLLPIIKNALGLVITLGLTDYYGFLNIEWTQLGAQLGITIGSGGASAVIGASTTILTTIGATLTGTGTGGIPTTPPTGIVGNSVSVASTFVTTAVGTGSRSLPTGVSGGNNGEDSVSTAVGTGSRSLPTGVSGGNDDEDSDGDYEDCDEEDEDPQTGSGNHGNGNANGGLPTTTTGVQGGATTTTGSRSVPTGVSGGNDGEDGEGDYEDCDDEDEDPQTGSGNHGNGSSGAPTTTTGVLGGATTTATNGGTSSAVASTTTTNGSETDIVTSSAAPSISSGVLTTATTSTATSSGTVSTPSQCAAGADESASVYLVAVVQEVSVKVTPLVERLKALSVSDCTKDNIQGIATEIKAVFTTAVTQIKVLVGASINVVLAKECGSDVVLSVNEFAAMFATLINLIFGAITVVLKTASGTSDYKIILSILADLGICIGDFIKVTCDIVAFSGGLITVLVPLIQASLGVCVTLGIKASFEFLQIDWTKLSVDIGVSIGVVSVVSIVNNCTATITPLIEKLNSLSASDCTAGTIQPIVIEIKSALIVCTDQIKLLIGASVDVVLASGSGTLISVSECAKLIADLVNLVFGACGAVLKIAVSAEYKTVVGLFADLGVSISELIKITTTVVTFDGGITSALTPLIHSSLALCVTLGIKSSFDFLDIDWTQIGVGVGVGATVSIVTILNNCTSTITPLIQKLKDLKAEECTADTIRPIVAEIKGVLLFCIEQIKLLVGASVEVVLASGAGAVISVGDCANLVGSIVKLVFDACGGILKIVVAAELESVISIFAELGVLVGTFIQTCISVVTFDGGLLVSLMPIIKTSLGVCIQLNITNSFDFLHIDFKQFTIDLGIGVGAGVSVTLQTIITDLITQITPLIEHLKGLNASDCTSDAVGSIISDIKVVVAPATEQVKGLQAGVSISIDEITTSITGLLQLVFGALDVVLKVVVGGQAKTVFSLCADLGSTIAVFIQSVCSLDTTLRLQSSIVTLVKDKLKDVFSVVIKLAITGTFSFLKIDFDGLCGELGLNVGGILNTLV